MHIHRYFYKAVHIISLTITLLVFPAAVAYLLFFYDAKTVLQFHAEGKIIMYYIPFIISAAISGLLFALRKEKAPTKLNHYTMIGVLVISICFSVYSGYYFTKNYASILSDDIPISKEGNLTNLVGYHDKLYSLTDASKYGQTPISSYGKPNRYAIEFKVDNESFHTAFMFFEIEFNQTLTRLKELENERIIVTYLPNTKQIVRIEENHLLPTKPIYENSDLLERR